MPKNRMARSATLTIAMPMTAPSTLRRFDAGRKGVVLLPCAMVRSILVGVVRTAGLACRRAPQAWTSPAVPVEPGRRVQPGPQRVRPAARAIRRHYAAATCVTARRARRDLAACRGSPRQRLCARVARLVDPAGGDGPSGAWRTRSGRSSLRVTPRAERDWRRSCERAPGGVAPAPGMERRRRWWRRSSPVCHSTVASSCVP